MVRKSEGRRQRAESSIRADHGPPSASRRDGLDTTRINAYTWIGATWSGRWHLEQDLYFISVAARMLGMHPQTLRKYERLGWCSRRGRSAACGCTRATSSSGCG